MTEIERITFSRSILIAEVNGEQALWIEHNRESRLLHAFRLSVILEALENVLTVSTLDEEVEVVIIRKK